MTFDPTGVESQITLTRTIDVPVEDVFSAWTDPVLLEQWQADEVETEPFVGGHYRYVTQGDEEAPGEYIVTGEYLEFVENKRLAMSWISRAADDEDDDDEVILVIEVDFKPLSDERTEITIVERGAIHADPESRIFSIEAWSSAIDFLADLME